MAGRRASDRRDSNQRDSDRRDSGRRDPDREFADRIARRQSRKLRAKREGDRGPWFGLGMFGLVGWSVAIPSVLGALLGVWLDKAFPGPRSWTLMLLFVGVVCGCAMAWFWVRREGEAARRPEDFP
ncbi:MAG: AtpZ/AtpI family protein [Desulfococcaceae bacterium]